MNIYLSDTDGKSGFVRPELESEFSEKFPSWLCVKPSDSLYSSALMLAGATEVTKNENGEFVFGDIV